MVLLSKRGRCPVTERSAGRCVSDLGVFIGLIHPRLIGQQLPVAPAAIGLCPELADEVLAWPDHPLVLAECPVRSPPPPLRFEQELIGRCDAHELAHVGSKIEALFGYTGDGPARERATRPLLPPSLLGKVVWIRHCGMTEEAAQILQHIVSAPMRYFGERYTIKGWQILTVHN